MRKLILLVFVMIFWQTNFSQNGWNRISYGNQNQTFNQTVTITDNGYTGTAIVPFPVGASNLSWLKRGSAYYAKCFWNNDWYERLITNIYWYQPRMYNHQFNQNWNCQVNVPAGYNYLGYGNNNNNYYADYYYGGNYYRQPIGLYVTSIILNSAAAIINNLQWGNNQGWNNNWNNQYPNGNWRW